MVYDEYKDAESLCQVLKIRQNALPDHGVLRVQNFVVPSKPDAARY
jgi:hypothetical protein